MGNRLKLEDRRLESTEILKNDGGRRTPLSRAVGLFGAMRSRHIILMMMPDEVTTLYRPVGQTELDLIRASGLRRFPPRLPHQPFFYPVLNEVYATQIARDWNTKDEASGFV